MQTAGSKVSGFISLFIVQVLLLILFAIYVRYEEELLPKDKVSKIQDEGLDEKHVSKYYPHFQDIHVMIFIGFGFLMTFLKRYGYSATGFTLLLGALIIQWSILMKGFLKMKNGIIRIGLENLIDADIAAAVPLISMGALLGRTTPIQLLFMSIIEIVIFVINEFVQLDILKITDVGGSITVHAFGAYFGLAVSCILRPKKDENNPSKNEESNYTSDIFAMIGTVFLWIFWPSFNSVLVDGGDRERAIINTYLSLASATVTSFVISTLVNPDNKLDMVHVQNSTLAGGVAVGSVCNLLIGPHGAILIGIISGTISVIGYRFLTPIITSKLRIHDTCGVHNLHGMPAIISAIFSAIYACLAKKDDYKDTLIQIFPAMIDLSEISSSTNTSSSSSSSSSISSYQQNKTEIVLGGYGRSALEQGGYQLLGITLTILIAIISGALTGMLLRSPNLRKIPKDYFHDDEVYWQLPEKEQKFTQAIRNVITTVRRKRLQHH